MPAVVVDDADWTLKRKAKQYRKFILGEMMATEFDQRSKEALRDGAVIGSGWTAIDDTGDGEKVFAERMMRDELFFDPRECKYGKPPNAIRIRRFARDHLMDLYPEHAAAIVSANPARMHANEELDDEPSSADLEDYVDVYEAYHLPRGEGDGRIARCINNKTLDHVPWEEPRFPWCGFKWQKRMRGFWPKGLIYDLKDIQHRINCIVRDIQMNVQATGRGHYLQQQGHESPIDLLTGWMPHTITYKGNSPPTWNAPQPFNQAQLNALEFFINQAYDLPGVSRLSATSKSSLGSGASGVALDTQYDIESDRFAMEEGQYADYRMEGAQLYVDASKRVARKREDRKGTKRSSAYVSSYIRGDAIEKLEHDKVSLESEQFKLQLEPTGFIPTTRAGKLSAVGQLAQAGIIPQWLAAALFDEPDLARSNRITLGAFYNAERKMEQIADHECEMPMPAQYNDLDLELVMTKGYLNYAESERNPKRPDEILETALERYRQYLDLVTQAIQERDGAVSAAQPPAPAMPAQAQMPGAAPMLPPGAPMPDAGGAPAGPEIPPEMMPQIAA